MALEKQNGGMIGGSPQAHLQKTLYLLNHLTIREGNQMVSEDQKPVILKHFLSIIPTHGIPLEQKDQIWVKLLEMNKWEEQFHLITWGRGYVCVSTVRGPRCLPARCTRLYFPADGWCIVGLGL